jgi:hypothetical protein
MEWFAKPLMLFWSRCCPWVAKKSFNPDEREVSVNPARRNLKKVPFYSQIPTTRIRLYQTYIDRAFELSPTLEFALGDDRFNRLLKEAAYKDSLSVLDLELMRMQYVLADETLREQCRESWAVKVVNRQEDDFFPSPWSILSAMFTGTP